MRRGASAYEREIKELLQGRPEAVRAFGRSLPPTERESVERVLREPFLVVRAAGSLGFDLVALRAEFAFPIEVKSSSEPTILFSAASGRAAAQLAAHRDVVRRVGLLLVYAYRRVGYRGGDPWRLFAATTPPPGGTAAVLGRRLPPVDFTRDGRPALRWEHGMSLVRFLELVHFLTRRPEPSAEDHVP